MFLSERKDQGMWALVIGILIIVAVSFMYIILPNLPTSTTDLRIGDGIFKARIASNDNARTAGLSGETSLAADRALLMAFPTDGKWGIWMKDMKIPVDIVWLDSNKKVIYIIKNASPADSTSVTYTPKSLAKYVIEFPAGTVDGKAINMGSVATFSINEGDVK